MTILVTGGNGMLGSTVVEQLLAQGETVRSLDLTAHPNPAVTSAVGDIRDTDFLDSALRGVNGVIHTASMVDLHLGQPRRLHEVNVEGTRGLIQACRQNGVDKFAYMSSAEVISGAEPLRNADEQAPYPRPHLTYYGITKEEAESLVLAANDEQLATCAFRTFGIFGEGDRHFISQALVKINGKRLPKLGTSGITDTVYVGNVAHALILGIRQLEIGHPVSGQIFHITDHETGSVQDLLVELLAPFGYAQSPYAIPIWLLRGMAQLFELPYRLTKLERFAYPWFTSHQLRLGTQDYYLNRNKIEQMLGYTPKFTRAEAVERTQAWLRATRFSG